MIGTQAIDDVHDDVRPRWVLGPSEHLGVREHHRALAVEGELELHRLVRERCELDVLVDPVALLFPSFLVGQLAVHPQRHRHVGLGWTYREPEPKTRRADALAPKNDTRRCLENHARPAVTVDGDVAHFERSAGADDDSIEPPHARCVDFAHVHETLVDAVAGRERAAAGGHQQS